MILVGKIIKPHGLRGGLKCRIVFKDLHKLLAQLAYYDGHNLCYVKVASMIHLRGEIWILYLHEVNRYSSASHLCGADLFIENTEIIPIDQLGFSSFLGMDIAMYRTGIGSDENATYIIGLSMGVSSVADTKLLYANFSKNNLVAKHKIGNIYIPFELSTFPMIDLTQSTIFIDPYWIK